VRRRDGPLLEVVVESVGRSYIDIEDDRPNIILGGRYPELVDTKDDQARGSEVGSEIEMGVVQGDRAE
jgi:hypothetical protein